MNDQVLLGVLLVTVWSHDGQSVARLRAFRSVNRPPEELGVAVGDLEISTAVSEWLKMIGRPRADKTVP